MNGSKPEQVSSAARIRGKANVFSYEQSCLLTRPIGINAANVMR